MSSSFFGLNIAYSGLNTSHIQINTTANNISNINTEGYSRQKVEVEAAQALRVYQKYGTTGAGVNAVSVGQTRDEYYDVKFWNNQAQLGFYDKKQYYMEQIESYYSEVASDTSGFSTIYSKMFNALDTVKTKAEDVSVRNEFVSNCQELCTYFNHVSSQLQDMQATINDEIKTTTDQINAIAKKVALLNKQINVIEIQGGTANELRDERARLVDELSAIVPVEVKEVPVANTQFPDMQTNATRYTLKINNQNLVDEFEYNTLTVKARDKKYNLSDIDGLYDVVWADTGARFDATSNNMSGTLKAMFEIRDGNNKENLTGRVTGATNNTLTISSPSVDIVNKMNMPQSGSIMVNNTHYTYSSFECETDEDGNILTYTFNLDQGLLASDQTNLMNRKLEVGKAVDFMGVPYYQNQMTEFVRNFCEAFNDIEKKGQDYFGNPMGTFFVAKDEDGSEWTFDDKVYDTKDADGNTVTGVHKFYVGNSGNPETNMYYQMNCSNVAVAYETYRNARYFSTTKDIDVGGIAAADLVDELAKLEKDTVLFRGGGGDMFLQCIYADVTVDTQECTVFAKNYNNIKKTIENQRLSVAGVDEDEEAMDLVKFQNAYNLASKCMQVFTEIYDRLILETGV